jgi:hypothetical protein
MKSQRMTIEKVPTGYWTVRRGSVQLSGGLTRHAAEAERDLFERLQDRSSRRRRPNRARASLRPLADLIDRPTPRAPDWSALR